LGKQKYVDRFHSLTFINTLIGSVLSKNDFRLFSEAKTIEGAIESIAHKPLGEYLSTILRVKGGYYSSLVNSLDEYLRTVLNNIIGLAIPLYREDVYVVENLYDTVNIIQLYTAYLQKTKPQILFPGGTLYLKGFLVDNIDLREALRLSGLLRLFENEMIVEKLSISKILQKLLSILKLREGNVRSSKTRNMYRMIYDYLVLKTSYSLGYEFLAEGTISGFGFGYDALESFARERSFDSLYNLLRARYVDWGEIYRELNELINSIIALDYAHILFLARASANMLMPYSSELYLRAILLIRAENVFTKLALGFLFNQYDMGLFQSLINRWWFY